MKRKYWIGWSDVEDMRPEDHEIFVAESEEDLSDIQAIVAELISEDWLGQEGSEDDD